MLQLSIEVATYLMDKEATPRQRAGYRPDFRLGDTCVEVKSDLHSFRNLRAALVQLAYYVAGAPQESAILVLTNPRIANSTLTDEWERLEQTLHPKILGRLALAVRRKEGISIIGGKSPKGLSDQLPKYVDQEARSKPYRAPQSSDAILLVLLNEWLQRNGPMTAQWLIQAVGCSYPTAAKVLRRLQHGIKRFSDRRFQLWGFPTEEWQRVVANRERAHPTVYYTDRSRQRRIAESLLRRASGLDRNDIAVSGVIAANHYYPEFDLRGMPRLDLTLHSPDGRADLTFVESLDPALEPAILGLDEPVALAVHVLRRQASLFETNTDGLPWADRVSTVLSLYDARLEPQAKELLDNLVQSVG